MWNLKSILVHKLKIAYEPKYFINRMFLYVGVFIPSSGGTPKLLRWLFQFVEQFLTKALNCKYFNPFAPEPPVTARADPSPFYLCDVISFNGQRQLCPLTCAEWRNLSNHTRMSTIQSRTPEKEAKNHVTLTWKSPWKSCFIAHLPFLSPNPKILKAFLKTLPTKTKPTKCPAREKKMRQEKRKKRGGEKAKSKSQDSKFCFLRIPELRKLIQNSPAKNVYACSTKNDTWSISGNVIGSEAKIPAKCCWDERSDGSFFWQWQRCNFLPL